MGLVSLLGGRYVPTVLTAVAKAVREMLRLDVIAHIAPGDMGEGLTEGAGVLAGGQSLQVHVQLLGAG